MLAPNQHVFVSGETHYLTVASLLHQSTIKFTKQNIICWGWEWFRSRCQVSELIYPSLSFRQNKTYIYYLLVIWPTISHVHTQNSKNQPGQMAYDTIQHLHNESIAGQHNAMTFAPIGSLELFLLFLTIHKAFQVLKQIFKKHDLSKHGKTHYFYVLLLYKYINF